jgi:hypothetical protein
LLSLQLIWLSIISTDDPSSQHRAFHTNQQHTYQL